MGRTLTGKSQVRPVSPTSMNALAMPRGALDNGEDLEPAAVELGKDDGRHGVSYKRNNSIIWNAVVTVASQALSASSHSRNLSWCVYGAISARPPSAPTPTLVRWRWHFYHPDGRLDAVSLSGSPALYPPPDFANGQGR
jgi:hypothetical protein